MGIYTALLMLSKHNSIPIDDEFHVQEGLEIRGLEMRGPWSHRFELVPKTFQIREFYSGPHKFLKILSILCGFCTKYLGCYQPHDYSTHDAWFLR